jgi:hypothetical protein
MRLEGLGQLLNAMTSSRIEPARHVAQCLNQLRYRVHPQIVDEVKLNYKLNKCDGLFFDPEDGGDMFLRNVG